MAYMLKKASPQNHFEGFAEMLSFITTLPGEDFSGEAGASLSVLQIFRDGNDAELVVADERDDVVAFGAFLNVGLDALESIEDRSAGLIDVTVALGDVVDTVLADVLLAEDGGVDSEIGGWIVSHDAEWRHIACDAATTLDEHPVAYARVFVDYHARRKNRALSDFDVTCNRDIVADHIASFQVGVMADMGVGHKERTGADACAPFRSDATVDNHVFTYHNIVTHEAICKTAFPAEILRISADNRTLIYLTVLSDA